MVQKIGSKANMATRNRKEKFNENASKFLSVSINQKQQHQKRFMGVRQSSSGRWVAEIKCTAQKIRLWLGTFDTPEDAAHAYDEAACLLRGPNTRTNFWPCTTNVFDRSSNLNTVSTSMLSAKVLNHLLNHLNTQQASKSPNSSPSPPSKSPPQQINQQQNHNKELVLISKMNYGELFSDVSTSSATTHCGDKKEFSMCYENNVHDEMKGKVEMERDVNLVGMDFRLEDLSYFFAPFETEGREMVERGTYEYWSMLYTAAKGV